MEITEQEIPGMRGENPKGGAYNYDGCPVRVEIKASAWRNTFVGALKDESLIGDVCNGMFVYTAKRNTLKAGHAKAESYIDNARMLEARFFLGGFRGDTGTNGAAPKAQFRSLGVSLSIIAYGDGILE